MIGRLYFHSSSAAAPTPKNYIKNVSFSSSASSPLSDADCHLCQKFGKGPCGTLFEEWFECTDRVQKQSSTNDKAFLTECEKEFVSWQHCMTKQEDYYSRDGWHPHRGSGGKKSLRNGSTTSNILFVVIFYSKRGRQRTFIPCFRNNLSWVAVQHERISSLKAPRGASRKDPS